MTDVKVDSGLIGMGKKSTVVTYYARNEGARYCFVDGGVARFVNGMYQFDPESIPLDYSPPEGKTAEEGWKARHKELEYVCRVNNPVFSVDPVPLHKSDAVILREIGHSGGGVGLVGSFQTGGNLAGSPAGR